MGFVDELFPTEISLGSTGGLLSDNVRTLQLPSRFRTRIIRNELPLWIFNVSYGLRRFTDDSALQAGLDNLQNFVMAVGFENSFRYHYPLNYRSSLDGMNPSDAPELDCLLVPDDETRLTYQLRKLFRYGSVDRYMPITRPYNETVRIAIDESETSSFTMGPMGKVILDSDPGEEAVVTGGFEYDFEVGFASDPRDAIEFEMTRSVAGQVRSEIVLYQEPVSVPHSEHFWPGGSKNHGVLTGNVFYSLGEGVFHVVTDNDGRIGYLPDPDEEYIPSGKDIIVVKNLGTGTHEVRLKSDGTLVKELDQGQGAKFSLWRDDSMATGWEAASPL